MEFSAGCVPSLTTVRWPHDRIGDVVVECLLRRLNDSTRNGEIVDLGFELIVRQSG
jgi:LacI family transcriptional regulator/LacI family repressor for deo operon, udp, cdd, tsx, nupC, and nupG